MPEFRIKLAQRLDHHYEVANADDSLAGMHRQQGDLHAAIATWDAALASRIADVLASVQRDHQPPPGNAGKAKPNFAALGQPPMPPIPACIQHRIQRRGAGRTRPGAPALLP